MEFGLGSGLIALAIIALTIVVGAALISGAEVTVEKGRGKTKISIKRGAQNRRLP
jgi:hypothetical protein